MVRTTGNTVIDTLLDSLALTPKPEFATNEDTSGNTGLPLPGGSIKGVFETVVTHLARLGDFPDDAGVIYIYRGRISTSADHGDRDSQQPKYAVNATPICRGSLAGTSWLPTCQCPGSTSFTTS